MGNLHPKHAVDGFKTGLTVQVKRDDVEKAMRILKKKVAQEGILKELRRREFYEKPSEARRRRKAEARNRWHKKKRQLEEDFWG